METNFGIEQVLVISLDLHHTLPSNPNMAICSNSSTLVSNSASAIFMRNSSFFGPKKMFAKKPRIHLLELGIRMKIWLLLNLNKQLSPVKCSVGCYATMSTHYVSCVCHTHVFHGLRAEKLLFYIFNFNLMSFHWFQRKIFFEQKQGWGNISISS